MDIDERARLWARFPEIYGVRASGDGAWVFWTAKGDQGADVFCAPVSGGPVEQLTFGSDGFDIRDVSRDGMRLVLGQSRDASEHDHLLLLDRTLGNRLRLLTPKQDSHYVYGGAFTPDEKGVIYLANHDYARDADIFFGAILWQQDLTSGNRIALSRLPRLDAESPSFSPNGKFILLNVHTGAPGASQVWVFDMEARGWIEVLKLGETQNSRGVWIDDDRIGVITDHGGRDHVVIVRPAQPVRHWGADGVWPAGVEVLASEPEICPHHLITGHGRIGLVAHRGSRTLSMEWVDGAWRDLPNPSGRRSQLIHAALPGGFVTEAYDADGPHEIWAGQRLDRGAGRGHLAPRDLRWSAPDGAQVQGWLYRPEAPKGLVVKVHGGPTWHSEDWCHPWIGFFTDLGWAVLDPNYRGSTGFGHDWREAIKAEGWGAAEQGDIRAGIEAALAEGIPPKVCVTGVSYGGFSSFYALTRMADLVHGAIPVCGMWKLDLDFEETGQEHLRDYSIQMMGGRPDQVPDRYANGSPGNFVAGVKGRVMVVQGLADTNVDPANAHAALADLRAAGHDPEELLFPDEGHGIARPANLETFFRRAAGFLDRL